MAKVDIEAAYRHVPIDAADWDELAFRWPSDSDSDLYVDGYLQFGLMNARKVFKRIGRVILRMMACKGFKCLISYMSTIFYCLSRPGYDLVRLLGSSCPAQTAGFFRKS
jgi:hypothetical protein